MTFCTNCGKEIPEGMRFCSNCGTPVAAAAPTAAPTTELVPVPTPAPAAEPAPAPRRDSTEVLNTALRNMRWERKAWKITGYAFVGMMAFIFIYMVFIFGGSGLLIRSLGGSSSDTRVFSIMGVLYAILIPLLYLPVVIVSFHMNQILGAYANAPDHRNMFKHVTSVGNIVFCALFSTPALVFTIINFVYCKQNRAALEEACAANQSAFAYAYQ